MNLKAEFEGNSGILFKVRGVDEVTCTNSHLLITFKGKNNIPDILRNASNVEKITEGESKICLTGVYDINVMDR